MKLLFRNYDKAGRGIKRDEEKKVGFARFWEILTIEYRDIVKVNIYFMLTCLGIITIPAAITALSGITMMMVRDVPRFTIEDFRKIFRKEFKRSTLLGWLGILSLIVTFYGAYFYWSMTEANPIMWVTAIAMIGGFFLILAMMFYLFPMIASVELTSKQYIKNSFYLVLLGLKHSIPALLLFAVLLFLMLALFPVSLVIIFFFFFSFTSLVISFFVYKPINDYVFLTKDDRGDGKNNNRQEVFVRENRKK